MTRRGARLAASRRARALALVAWLLPARARAYPSSIAFVPNAEATPFGRVVVGAFAMASVRPSRDYVFGYATVQVGLLPRLSLGRGVEFGGLEADVDYYDVPHAPNQLAGNAKLALLTEGAWWPSTAVGMMGIAPGAPINLMLGYVVASRSLGRGAAYGRLTLGLARSFASRESTAPGCFARGMTCALRGTVPFKDRNLALLAGYELVVGRFSLGVDHFGGSSVFSTTNLQVAATFGAWQPAVGIWITHERARPDVPSPDGLYVSLLFGFDLIAAPKPEVTPPGAGP